MNKELLLEALEFLEFCWCEVDLNDFAAAKLDALEAKLCAAINAPVELTDAEIVAIAIASRGAEPGKCGYILPITFGRALLAAQRRRL